MVDAGQKWQGRARQSGLRTLYACLVAVLTFGCGGELTLEGEDFGGDGLWLGLSQVVTPLADATVEKARPTSNYGSSSRLLVDGSPELESYLKFEVSGLTAPPESVKLRLYAFNGSSGGPSVFTTGDDWQESTITWSSRPAPTGSAVARAGSVPKNAWIELDVTSAIQRDGTYSFVLRPNSGNGVDFYSRTGSRPPQLLIVPAATSDAGSPEGGSDDAGTDALAVALTSPADGARFTSAGSVDLVASVSGNVTRVEFFQNGQWAGTEDTSPFALTWTLSASQNGTHTWAAMAYGADGATATSATISLTVDVAESSADGGTGGTVTASHETTPVPHTGDAADDSAVWIHPTDPAKSAIIGTDKLGGIAVYDLSGKQLHYYADGRHNNVDVRYGFALAGEQVALVVSTEVETDTLRVYRVDPATRALQHISARAISVGIGVYGLCMYKSQVSGKFYAIDSDSSGTVQQWELFEVSGGKVDARKVRQFTVGSTTEGCVADDENGALFIAEEDVGIWRYGAEPDTGTSRVSVDAISQGKLRSDIEGLTIYVAPGGLGYLIASSQGANEYVVYERAAPHRWVKTFRIEAGAIDEVTYTDGIEVSSFALPPLFPEGVFIAQDDRDDSGRQNYKIVPWGSVARAGSTQLLIDGRWDPRTDGKVDGDTGGGTSDGGTSDGGTSDGGTSDGGTSGGQVYYVDPVSGSDSNDGLSTGSAWKSVTKANQASLLPGDQLLFKRNSSFSGTTLQVSARGTQSQPVVVGAYGTGAAPRFTGDSTCISATGSDLVIRELHADACSWAGVSISGSAVVLTNMRITGNAAGVQIRSGAYANKVLHSDIIDNNRMSVLTEGGGDDSGAFGILLQGDDNEIAYNTISGCDAFSYDYGRDGAAVEIYGGQRNHIHHNVAVDNDAFTELGHSRSADNTFAFNVVRSSLATSVFVVTRGSASSYGPVLRTRLINNSVHFTGAQSQGFVCHAGCSGDILMMRNNVIVAGWKVGYADAPFDEDYNLYHQGQRQFLLGANSLVADPLFNSPSTGDLSVRTGSPAIDTGTPVPYGSDILGQPTNQDGNADGLTAFDRGAYEKRP